MRAGGDEALRAEYDSVIPFLVLGQNDRNHLQKKQKTRRQNEERARVTSQSSRTVRVDSGSDQSEQTDLLECKEHPASFGRDTHLGCPLCPVERKAHSDGISEVSRPWRCSLVSSEQNIRGPPWLLLTAYGRMCTDRHDFKAEIDKQKATRAWS